MEEPLAIDPRDRLAGRQRPAATAATSPFGIKDLFRMGWCPGTDPGGTNVLSPSR
ncbi:MAG: hypothetical protein WAK82_13595 [Streptosporangiaceae bacterium]